MSPTSCQLLHPASVYSSNSVTVATKGANYSKHRELRQTHLKNFATSNLTNDTARNNTISDQLGAPGAIRTPDPLVRSQVLYPTELRARCISERRASYTHPNPSSSLFRIFSIQANPSPSTAFCIDVRFMIFCRIKTCSTNDHERCSRH